MTRRQDEIARIQKRQADVRAFVAEQRELSKTDRFGAWRFLIGGLVSGAVLFGSGMAFVKLIG